MPDKAAQDKVSRAVRAQDALVGRKSKDAALAAKLADAKKRMK